MAGSLTPAELWNAAITLENDSRFYKTYTASPDASCTRRREHIKNFAEMLGIKPKLAKIADREQLRRYFDKQYHASEPPDHDLDDYVDYPTVKFWLDEVRYPPDQFDSQGFKRHCTKAQASTSSPRPTPTENTMTKAIEITTKTLANGVDVASMSDSDIYGLIAAQEAGIVELEKIVAKPKKLVAEITKRREGIAALVAYLDSKE